MNLEDIARLAGVSRSTVSRVVNDDPRVSESVRSRVHRIIAETNYHPNASARSLATHRTRIIGLVIAQPMGEVFNDAWFPVMIQGCMDACLELDYSLMLLMESSTDPVSATRLIERTVRSRHLDGLVISSTLNEDVLSAQLQAEEFPFVTIGRDRHVQHHFVDVDNRQAARVATEHLIRHGYRRLAMISGPDTMVASEDRRFGFLDALIRAEIDPTTAPIRYADYNEQLAYEVTLGLLTEHPDLDAIFSASDAMARGTLRAIRDRGLRIPEDIALIGFDGIQPDLVDVYGISTMRQPAKAVGHRAVELLISILNTPPTRPIQEWFGCELVVARSCGCAPARADHAPTLIPAGGFQSAAP